MFFKRFLRDNNGQQPQPRVKKVSELIDKTSHKQKKYISLMLVPSYSTGKTRSLRIPRSVLHGAVASMFVVSAIVAGFYLRSNYFMRMAHDLYETVEEITETFEAFQYEAEIVQGNLTESVIQMYEQYSEVQQNVQNRLDDQAREHQTVLESLWEQVDDFEQMIRDLEAEQQAIIEGLGSRANAIPPIANILTQLETSRQYLIEYQATEYRQEAAAGFGFVGYFPQITEEALQHRINVLKAELNLQKELLADLESHRSRMSTYLRNYPTLWPIRGQISSGFGWRTNPMGGRGGEHHAGVDIPARTGTPIRAAGGGTVIFSCWQNGYGNTVIINHGNGITTLYAHNTRNRVEVGQRVERGDVIAYVGSTGRSTGPHLHYEVRLNNRAVNPIPFMVEHY